MIAADLNLDGREDVIVMTPTSGADINILLNGTTPSTGADCNANLAPDDCEIASGAVLDCQSDGIPDGCQLAANDCNANGVPDECDLSGGGSLDSNSNGLLDECETVTCGTCPGDLDGDGDVDGSDLQGFTSCVMGGSALAAGCGCADLDANAAANTVDISLMANKLLSDPNPACP